MLPGIWFKTLSQHELDYPWEKTDKLDSSLQLTSLIVVE